MKSDTGCTGCTAIEVVLGAHVRSTVGRALLLLVCWPITLLACAHAPAPCIHNPVLKPHS